MFKASVLITTIALIVGLRLMNQSVFAVDIIDVGDSSVCDINSEPAICNVDQSPESNPLVGPNGIITQTSQYLVYISGVLALILIIIAGFMFIFSTGNPQSAGRARSTVLYAVIGLAVAITGQAIVSFVLDKL